MATHACRILNASQKVIFLTPFELVNAKDFVDKAKDDGFRVVTIPENIQQKIKGLEDLAGNPIRDLEQFKVEWNQSFEFKFVNPKDLTREERMIFDKTKQIVDLIGGLPKNVKKIMISETMRMETSSYKEATGLWEAAEERIIIKRTQLRSLKEYAATLLHEIAHVRSGTSDISREFEDELTSLLGLISSNVVLRG